MTQVLYSKFSRRLHRYDNNRVDERCNTDSMLDVERVVMEVQELGIHEWAAAQKPKLKLCKRCWPGESA